MNRMPPPDGGLGKPVKRFEDTFSAQDAILQEYEMMMHASEMIAAGLAVRRAGLIWFLPLCHDAYGENI